MAKKYLNQSIYFDNWAFPLSTSPHNWKSVMVSALGNTKVTVHFLQHPHLNPAVSVDDLKRHFMNHDTKLYVIQTTQSERIFKILKAANLTLVSCDLIDLDVIPKYELIFIGDVSMVSTTDDQAYAVDDTIEIISAAYQE